MLSQGYKLICLIFISLVGSLTFAMPLETLKGLPPTDGVKGEIADLVYSPELVGPVALMTVDTALPFSSSAVQVSADGTTQKVLDVLPNGMAQKMMRTRSGALVYIGSFGEELGPTAKRTLFIRQSDSTGGNWQTSYQLDGWWRTRAYALTEVGSRWIVVGGGTETATSAPEVITLISDNEGKSWKLQRMPSPVDSAYSPAAVVGDDMGTIYVVIESERADQKSEILLRSSNDNGKTWKIVSAGVFEASVGIGCSNAIVTPDGALVLQMQVAHISQGQSKDSHIEFWRSSTHGRSWTSSTVPIPAGYKAHRARGIRFSKIDHRIYVPSWLVRSGEKYFIDWSLYSCDHAGSHCRLESPLPDPLIVPSFGGSPTAAYAIDFDSYGKLFMAVSHYGLDWVGDNYGRIITGRVRK